MTFLKITDLLEAAASKPVTSFPDYNMKGAEFAPIMKHVKQLLVPPRYIKGKRTYPPAWDPLRIWSASKIGSNKSKDDGSFHCEACNIRHTKGQNHMLAGIKKLREQYANRQKPVDGKPHH